MNSIINKLQQVFSAVLQTSTKRLYLFLTVLLVTASSVVYYGCSDFVQNVDPPIDSVDDDALNSESQLNFVITGVRIEYQNCYSQLSCLSGALSDELKFDRDVESATYPTYDEIDRGVINLNNQSVTDAMVQVGKLRFAADTLIERVKKMEIKDTTLRNLAFFTGYFYGAVARYFWAAYFGLEPTRGCGVINSSSFIP